MIEINYNQKVYVKFNAKFSSTIQSFSKPVLLNRKWYFVTKIVLVIEKIFWNLRLKAENCKIFEITKTIYSSSERSEQFLATECFF